MSMGRATEYHMGAIIDPTPLLGSRIFPSRSLMRQPPSLSGAARFLRRVSSRRMMREPSMRVREAAVGQIEERQSDWAYSKPIVALDLLWNLIFLIVSVSLLITSRKEKPEMPLRVWIVGYCLQCVLHVACVCLEFKRRSSLLSLRRGSSGSLGGGRWNSGDSRLSSSGSDEGANAFFSSDPIPNDDELCVVKNLESANTMFSFIWWIIGFYWISVGSEFLSQESPQLYWLCIAFLAFDVLFVVLCVAVACVIGLAVCCCLPCIIAILYALADQDGATRNEIEQLPKYRFRRNSDAGKQNGDIEESSGGIMIKCDVDTPVEHVLPLEDAECCICLSAYEDGSELRELPCHHHFHCECIDKWLSMNAICPLCKYNILKNDIQTCTGEV